MSKIWKKEKSFIWRGKKGDNNKEKKRQRKKLKKKRKLLVCVYVLVSLHDTESLKETPLSVVII